MSEFRLQDPDETLAYSVDWGTFLATGDTVSSASWEITPSGPTVNDLGESGNVSSARVSGLTYGEIYILTCRMVTTDGETADRSFTIRCGRQ